MIALREFKTAAEMRAHYDAVRARIFGPPPPRILRPPAPPAPPAPPPVPAPVVAKVLERAEQRRRILINAALLELQEGEGIIKLAALHFGVTVEEIKGRKRAPPTLFARHVAAYVMREYFGRNDRRKRTTTHSLAWIGKRLCRDHTCILNAEKRVRNSPQLLEAAAAVLQLLEERNGPYVAIESFVRVDPEAYTLKRTCRAGAEL
jgi:hypothetical protein